MSRRRSSTFTEVELEFMRILWNRGEVSTEDIQNDLREQDRLLSDGSIRKILSILIDKGHLIRRREGRKFLYSAKEKESQSHHNIVQDILNRAFGGRVSHMVAALFDSRDISPGDIDAIKKLIAEHEEKEERKKSLCSN